MFVDAKKRVYKHIDELVEAKAFEFRLKDAHKRHFDFFKEKGVLIIDSEIFPQKPIK